MDCDEPLYRKASPDGENDATFPDGTADEKTDSEFISLDVLQSVKDAQLQHGLRHGDYNQYRQYCTRRFERIRHCLRLPLGTNKRVKPIHINQERLSDARHLQFILTQSERCWAHAMQLRADSAKYPRRQHFHMTARLRKAVKHASELNDLVLSSPKVDAKTKLEIQAYYDWMHASLHFYTKNYREAIQRYASSQTIYTRLADAVAGELKQVYQARISEMQPNVRYAKYTIGESSDDDDSADSLAHLRLAQSDDGESRQLIDDLISRTRQRQAATMSEISWQGRTIPVKNEQARLFLIAFQEWNRTGAIVRADSLDGAAFDEHREAHERLLKDCNDALHSLREQLNVDPAYRAASEALNETKNAAVNDAAAGVEVSSSHYLFAYLSFLRIIHTMERARLLIHMHRKNLGMSRQPGALPENAASALRSDTTAAAASGDVEMKDATRGGGEGAGATLPLPGASPSSSSSKPSSTAAAPAPSKPTKPQDLVRLYDIMMQQLTELSSLQLLRGDTVAPSTMTAQMEACRIYRCYFLAMMYGRQRKWPEAMALCGKVLLRFKTNSASFSFTPSAEGDPTGANEMFDGLASIVAAAEELQFTGRAGYLLDTEQQGSSKSTQRKAPSSVPLIDRLDDYYEELPTKLSLVHMPPEMKPVPVKPIFFDLAQSHITLPDLSDRVETKKGSGITGAISSWWWGAKK